MDNLFQSYLLSNPSSLHSSVCCFVDSVSVSPLTMVHEGQGGALPVLVLHTSALGESTPRPEEASLLKAMFYNKCIVHFLCLKITFKVKLMQIDASPVGGCCSIGSPTIVKHSSKKCLTLLCDKY